MNMFRKSQMLRTEEAREVFRQFAWNLAGSLAAPKRQAAGKSVKRAGGAKPRPARVHAVTPNAENRA